MQKNIDEAVKWLRKAAELGNQEAMLKLGTVLQQSDKSFSNIIDEYQSLIKEKDLQIIQLKKSIESVKLQADKNIKISYMDGYNDANEGKQNKYVKNEFSKAARFGNVKIGSIIKFGRYKQFKSKEEDIEWCVLDRKGNRALIISKYILDDKLFNNRYCSIFWKDSSLRKWLNNDFYNIAFNDTEKICILTSNVEAEYNPECSTSCGEDTKDGIFLLGIKDAKTLFSDNTARICEATYYARSNGVYIYNDGTMNARWRLRTNGCNEYKIVNVTTDGAIDYYGHDANDRGYGVRPAMWVKLD